MGYKPSVGLRLVVVIKNVPMEITEALDSHTFSFHIKGISGTGKTTLALEFMRIFPGESTGVYLSTRVSPDKLYEQFPWSKSCIHQENILDANTSLGQQTKEEYLFQYVDKPGFLRDLYSRVLEVKVKHSIIIVDSIDTLKSNLRIPLDDLSVERDILDLADRVKSNVIFISEFAEENRLDYLVDGVVRLEREFVNERLVRKLYIEKVRGMIIENPVYLFTLKDGRFTCFEKGIQINLIPAKLPEIEKKKGLKIPTLIPELDKILNGGFEGGTLNIFEVGEMVGMSHTYILVPIFLNFVRQGFPFFSIPSKGLFSDDVVKRGSSPSLKETLTSSLDEEYLRCLKKYFYVAYSAKNRVEDVETYNTYIIKGEDYTEDLNNFIEFAHKILDEAQVDTMFISIACDTLEYLYGIKEITKIIQSWIYEIRKINGILTMFQFGHETLKLQTHLATTYFKLENMGGNIVFYGEFPKTKMYITGLNISKGHIQGNLIPIE